jgi:hypothetical protein
MMEIRQSNGILAKRKQELEKEESLGGENN